jgi:hypothetical protein
VRNLAPDERASLNEMFFSHFPDWNKDSDPVAVLADRIGKMKSSLEQLAECNLTEENCASLEVASRRVRNIARTGLTSAGFKRYSEPRED